MRFRSLAGGLLVTAATTATALTAVAQEHQTLDHPVDRLQASHLDSGAIDNPGAATSVLFQDHVHVAAATSLRLYFGDVSLPRGSFVRITSLHDGEVQELTAATVAMWNDSSAYFNGDTLHVELVGGPGTTGNRLSLSQVAFQTPPMVAGGGGQCGICGGSDNRTPSSEEWTARLLPAGCTASVYNEESCMVTAGHCIGGSMVVQFNVPNSNGNCSLNNPPVADQFPASALSFVNGGPGNDWGVLTTGNNNQGQKPFDRYGEMRPIASTVAPNGAAVELTGYGVDLTCTLSQTQQTASGSICSVQSNLYTFSIDLRGGNSGSSLIRNDEIIGIATHCPCCNVATRIDLASFASAIGNCPGDDPTPIATGEFTGVDGYLSISPDAYGSWYVPFGGGSGDWQDRFNPIGSGLQPAAFTSGLFFFKGGQRELLSNSGDWQGTIGGDGTLSSAVTSANVATDTNGDNVDDTITSEFVVTGTGTNLTFDLLQHVENVSGAVSVMTQEYIITNNSASSISFELVSAFDGDLVWSGDFTTDEVGTGTNASTLERYVYMREVDNPNMAITISSPDGDAYYGGKHGIDPDGGGGSPAYDFGTDTEVWDAFGVPNGWRNHIAGVGYDSDGNSGASPGGSTDPRDAFIGLEIPVALGGFESTTVVIRHTYGDDEPPVIEVPCQGDTNDDGVVGVLDLINVITNWGDDDPGSDVNGDGIVDVLDLLDVILGWGDCP